MRKLNVNTAMSRPLKSAPQAKRVAPPAVPDVHRRSGTSFGSSPGYSSSLEDGGFTQTRDSPAALKEISDITADYGITHVPSKSPNSLNPYNNVTSNAFTFPISSRGEPLTHKVAVYYHQQLALQEDQGIDLTQSPGRDSPGSSSGSAGSGSRHSTASLDSGRASSYITGCGTSTRGALSSPRCSVSSCSIGSVDRMSQRSDNDIIMDWLNDIKFEEYAQLFSTAGYDLPTISRMTPEDLTAIGIKNPQHRERIKQHIDALHVPDNLPNFVPGSIEEWLRLLRLEEYIQPLLDQNYKTVRDVTQVTWEDLEDIGIVRLGHQKKILLAIKRVKDIISGKWNPKANSLQQDYHTVQSSRMSWDDSHGICSECSSINHENNDIVVIKIRQPRGKSLESLEDINEQNTRSHLTFSHYSNDCYSYFPQQPQQPQQISRNVCGVNSSLPYHVGNLAWRRSYDDGDITPTNDITTDLNEGGGTLPRQRISGSGRCRLIERSNSVTPQPPSVAAAMLPSLVVNSVVDYCPIESGGVMLPSNTRYGATCSPLSGKKQAPDPPRRQCSIRSTKSGTTGGGNNSIENSIANYDQSTRKYLHYDPVTSPRNSQQYILPSTHQPIYVNYSVQTHQTTVEVHCDKTHDTKSNSSIDSIDTIPFANENTGTIKQRFLNRQDISSSLSLSSSSSSSSTNTVANITQSLHSIKSTSGSLHEVTIHNSADHTPPSPTLPSPTNCPGGCNSGGSGNGSIIGSAAAATTTTTTTTVPGSNIGSGTGSIPSSSVLSLSPSTMKLSPLNLDLRYHHGPGYGNGNDLIVEDPTLSIGVSDNIVGNGSGNTTSITSNHPSDSVNVLNDIGNMLANLTDELDAMLEEEKRVGINDSE